MTTTSDLATLAAAKSWLGVSTSIDDALLGSLITAISRGIYGYLGRSSILPTSYSEWYDGKGNSTLTLRQWPVISVSSVIDGVLNIPAASAPGVVGSSQSIGWRMRPWNGLPPGGVGVLSLHGYRFCRGQDNVVVNYVSGYQVSAEAATIGNVPPYQVTAQQPYGPWASDQGVTYALSGAALTKVSSSPGAGQYSVSAGLYTFSAADLGLGVVLNYGFIPQALAQACIEQVAERYRYKDRIGHRSKSLASQETISYDLGQSGTGFTNAVLGLLGPYRQVTPLL